MKKLICILATATLSNSYAIGLKEIATGLKDPVWATAPQNNDTHFFILEKSGTIKVLDRTTGDLLTTPFLDIASQTKVLMNEQGLLGMAFSPDFNTSGRYYLNYTNTEGDTVISRFTCDPKSPLVTKPNSEEILITVPQDFRNHNGGWIGFGEDNMLYIGMGDGGSGNDPKNRAQDLTQFLGKLLRIDVSSEKGYAIPKDNPFVDQADAKKEIYAYGLRNPWRCAFDSVNKGFYIADVGQNKYEEVNYVSLKDLKGANFGWRFREGTAKNPKKRAGGAKQKTHIDPVYEYGRGVGSPQGELYLIDFKLGKLFQFVE